MHIYSTIHCYNIILLAMWQSPRLCLFSFWSINYALMIDNEFLNRKLPVVLKRTTHGCFITLKPWTKRLRPLIRNFFIATDLIMTLATHLFLWMDLFVQTVSIQCRRCLCTVSTMSTGINDVHLWRYRSILDVALACKSTG